MPTPTYQRIPWHVADPALADVERKRVLAVAPEMEWREDLVLDDREGRVGWIGPFPRWTADRPEPDGLDVLLADGPLIAQVIYREAFPVVAPVVMPVSVDPPPAHRTDERWHVNGNGTLCLMQQAWSWKPTDSAADLIVKAAGWYVEYLLMERQVIVAMTTNGIHDDASVDHLIAGAHGD